MKSPGDDPNANNHPKSEHVQILSPYCTSFFFTFLERKRAGIASGDEEPEDDEEGKEGEDGSQVPGIHDAITNRLKREEQEESGKFKQSIAENFSKDNAPDLFQTR